jgi:hypothetical protein
MKRALVALFILSMASAAMGQQVVSDDEKFVPLKHNPSYDNLYRPGNAIWRLRMLRMGMVPAINDTNADLNSTIDMGSVESSAMVAEPLRINNTRDLISMPSEGQRDMEDLLKDEATTKPAAKINTEGFEARREPNRNIVVQQINPRGTDVQPAAKGQVIVRAYDRSKQDASPIVSR